MVLTYHSARFARQWRPQGANADGSDILGRTPPSRGPISRPWFRVTAGTTCYNMVSKSQRINFKMQLLSWKFHYLTVFVAGCSSCFLFSASQIAIVRILLDCRMGSHRLCFPGRWCCGFWYFWRLLAFRLEDCFAFVHGGMCHHRRKFRSQTSDNMDRWKAEMGRVSEEKGRRKKIKKEKVSEERRSRCAKRWESHLTLCFSNDLWLRRVE